MKLRNLAILPLAFALNGCLFESDDDKEKIYAQCSAPDANNKLYDTLEEEYFWYKDLANKFNPEAYSDVKEALYALRAPQDRFSFAMTVEEYEDYVNSVFFGYGFSHAYNDNKDGLIIKSVFEEGSAAQNGLARGDTIKAINGKAIRTIIVEIEAGVTTLSEQFGPNEEGHTVEVTFEKPDGTEVVATFEKGSIQANTVMATQVKTVEIDNEEKKVGYLVFDSFDSRSEQELNTAFDFFAAENVDEIILDVRYNGGGLVRVARQLTTQIAGTNVEDEVFVRYIHNDKLTSQNSTSYFSLGAGIEKLNLDRVVVLTTGGSCSSSELVINALDPFVDVVTIGETSCGKPVGMYPTQVCDHVVFAINFQTQNAAGFGDYFDGLPVDCPVNDVVTGDWGVDSDPLLAEGLHYLANGNCSSAGVGPRSANGFVKKPFVEKPPVDFSQGPRKAKNLL